MEPAPAPLTDMVSGDSMPAELLAAFVEVMLESSRPPRARADRIAVTPTH